MTRLNFALFIALIATMLYVVRVQYDARRLFMDIEKTSIDVRKLEMENAALQVEKRAQATPLRIEQLAKERLHMRSASPAVTQYLQLGQDSHAGQTKAVAK